MKAKSLVSSIIISIPFFSIKFEAVTMHGGGLHQCRKHTVQYSVEEELVLLYAHSWTSARGNLRMAGAAKPRSPSRVEI